MIIDSDEKLTIKSSISPIGIGYSNWIWISAVLYLSKLSVMLEYILDTIATELIKIIIEVEIAIIVTNDFFFRKKISRIGTIMCKDLNPGIKCNTFSEKLSLVTVMRLKNPDIADLGVTFVTGYALIAEIIAHKTIVINPLARNSIHLTGNRK